MLTLLVFYAIAALAQAAANHLTTRSLSTHIDCPSANGTLITYNGASYRVLCNTTSALVSRSIPAALSQCVGECPQTGVHVWPIGNCTVSEERLADLCSEFGHIALVPVPHKRRGVARRGVVGKDPCLNDCNDVRYTCTHSYARPLPSPPPPPTLYSADEPISSGIGESDEGLTEAYYKFCDTYQPVIREDSWFNHTVHMKNHNAIFFAVHTLLGGSGDYLNLNDCCATFAGLIDSCGGGQGGYAWVSAKGLTYVMSVDGNELPAPYCGGDC